MVKTSASHAGDSRFNPARAHHGGKMITATRHKAGRKKKQTSGLAVGWERSMGLPMVETVQLINRKGLVMASNRRLDVSLITDEWRQVEGGFPCRSGTIVGYEGPDVPLGEFIQYMDPETMDIYALPVPEEHRGRVNIALVAEHPHFTLNKVDKVITVLTSQVGVIEDFPAESGWYLPDLEYGIPHGEKKSDRFQAARRLWRNEDSMVGLVVREAGDSDIRCHVGLRSRPSYTDLGAIVDMSKGGVLKSETKITADGVLLSGITLGQFTGLLAEAEDNYEQLRIKIHPAALEGIKRLLDALKLK